MLKTLVLVHGYLGGSIQWVDQVDAFSNDFHVVTVDLPGFGENSHMDSPVTINGYANYVLSELDDMGIEQFYLLGHSMGGMIVQEMAAIAPTRIACLVLYGTGPVGLLPGRFETIEESKQKVIRHGIAAIGPQIAAAWFMEKELSTNYHVCANLTQCVSQQAALAGLSSMQEWSGVELLGKVSCPTLVLWGDGDRSYQWSQPEQLWNGIKNAHLAVVPGTSHCVHLEKPELFNLILLDYLKTVS